MSGKKTTAIVVGVCVAAIVAAVVLAVLLSADRPPPLQPPPQPPPSPSPCGTASSPNPAAPAIPPTVARRPIETIDVTLGEVFSDGSKTQFVIDLVRGCVVENELSGTGKIKRSESWALDLAAIETFQNEAARVNLMSWEPSYDDPSIVDGSWWQLDLAYVNGVTKTVKGMNVFTPKVQPPNFAQFADALESLVGKAVL